MHVTRKTKLTFVKKINFCATLTCLTLTIQTVTVQRRTRWKTAGSSSKPCPPFLSSSLWSYLGFNLCDSNKHQYGSSGPSKANVAIFIYQWTILARMYPIIHHPSQLYHTQQWYLTLPGRTWGRASGCKDLPSDNTQLLSELRGGSNLPIIRMTNDHKDQLLRKEWWCSWLTSTTHHKASLCRRKTPVRSLGNQSVRVRVINLEVWY